MALGIVLLVLKLHAQQTQVIVARPQPVALQAGTAAITGAVIDATTGRPIAGALVTLAENLPGSSRRGFAQVATSSGRFAFVDLPPSEMYFVTATKPGWLDGGYGRLDPRGPGAPLSVRDGQWLRDVRVTMAHPGSISGTVSDERGEPLVGARVRVLPQIMIAGRVQWLAGIVAQTDDRGAYRLAGLGPGKYAVSMPSVQATLPESATIRAPGASAGTSMADLRAASEDAKAEKLLVDAGGGQQSVVGHYAVPPPPADHGRRMAYPIAFYPNVSTPAEAAPIALGVSEDRAGVDFRLRPVRTARVSGTIQGPPGTTGNLLLRLIPAGLEELGQGSEAATSVSLANGRFTFLDVPSGSYLLDVRHALLELTYTSTDEASTALPAPVPFSTRGAASAGVAAAPPGVEYSALRDWADMNYWGQVRIEVGDKDVDDLVLPLHRPASISGQLIWAPGVPLAASFPRPRLEPADGRRSLGILQFLGGNTSSFTLEGLMAGGYVLRVSGVSGVTVESITWDGQDYTERSFDGSAGHDFNGVVVTLTTASSTISGTVRDGTTPLMAGAAVIAFPVERERWSDYGFNPRRLKSAFTSSEGRYRLDGLPTGDYYLVAVPATQERAWIDPAFLASHAARATTVHIDRSDTKMSNVNLSLVK